MQLQHTPTQLAQRFKQACLDELSALKPGNVHIFADGHGMVVQDFIKSAEAASQVIALENLSVGQRILQAVNATWEAVGCNTNLGIILLAAPVIHAALHCEAPSYRAQLSETLRNLTVEDAVDAFQAIQHANPAGLGQPKQYDVASAPDVTLLVAMQAAQSRDFIARQYSNGFQEIIEFGLPIYRQALINWERPAWATTLLYLAYLSEFEDSHIARKYGGEIGLRVQAEAKQHYDMLVSCDNPKNYLKPLIEFDKELKAENINPGTSADLTVATLLINSLV